MFKQTDDQIANVLALAVNAYLQELQGNPRYRDGRSRMLRTTVEGLGYQVLGNGHFSVVIAHPYNEEKVIKLSCGGDSAGPTGDGWLSFACYAFNNPSPAFPTIDLVLVKSDCYVAVMERLTECTEFVDSSNWHKFLDERCQADVNRLSTAFRMDDLHSRNVMMRGQQIVINDPIAWPKLDTVYEPKKWIQEGRIDMQIVMSKRAFHEIHAPKPQISDALVNWAACAKDIDFAEMEQAVIAQMAMQDMHPNAHIRPRLKPRLQDPRWDAANRRIPVQRHNVWFHAYTRAKAIINDRAVLAAAGKEPAVRATQKDYMLRAIALHDHKPWKQGFLGALFQGRKPRRVPAARPAEPRPDCGAQGYPARATVRATAIAKGLYASNPE